MIERYKKELDELKTKMEKAEEWSNKMPYFKDDILDGKITGEEQWLDYGRRYKNIRLSWGLKRGWYDGVKNYNGDFKPQFLWYIYINTLSLYGLHEKFGLGNITNKCKVFFYDRMNGTFYLNDEYIGDFLDNLCEWYKVAISSVEDSKKKERVRKLEEELCKLKEASDEV